MWGTPIMGGGPNMWAVTCERWGWQILEIHPLVFYNRGILVEVVTPLFMIIRVGSSHKMESTYWVFHINFNVNKCNLGVRVWRWFLTLFLDSTFNFFKRNCKHIPSIEHALGYISIIRVGFKNELMEALWKL